ncbi:hypothetical protein BDN70DRAFT_601681 [Pholiota conissans]|uniref:Uncharacterized protein n=1 Tax=Pholiota conissans TaxID=109636 RepID=A0A9P5Z393_9AGAR|nr:hypothetical protein BDN70DRAFT_601681 [Pholiota conissans]
MSCSSSSALYFCILGDEERTRSNSSFMQVNRRVCVVALCALYLPAAVLVFIRIDIQFSRVITRRNHDFIRAIMLVPGALIILGCLTNEFTFQRNYWS